MNDIIKDGKVQPGTFKTQRCGVHFSVTGIDGRDNPGALIHFGASFPISQTAGAEDLRELAELFDRMADAHQLQLALHVEAGSRNQLEPSDVRNGLRVALRGYESNGTRTVVGVADKFYVVDEKGNLHYGLLRPVSAVEIAESYVRAE